MFFRSRSRGLAPAGEAASNAPILPPRPERAPDSDANDRRTIFQAASNLADGTVADEMLVAAISEEMDARRAATATMDGPANPRAANLRVRRSGLPDWWEGRNNLLLCSSDAANIELAMLDEHAPPEGAIVIIGEAVIMPTLVLSGTGALVVLGNRTQMINSTCLIGQDSTLLIGDRMTATWMIHGDARNGGIVVIGDDSMWASNSTFLTDDCHAIRDAATGSRINVRGGRIVVDRHVWVGERARLMGDCFVGSDGIVGAGSVVKNCRLPPRTISVGEPAKPVREGVTWTRDDDP